MSTDTIDNFKSVLAELNSLKPPGVSGSRIKSLKETFLNNVSLEAELAPILISACKNANNSNKLGPLYVLDAIVRGLIDETSKSENVAEIGPDSESGTAQAAVYKLQQNIEDIIDDSVSVSNDDVKDKIAKLIEIWDHCNTFKKKTIENIKNNHFKSHTPPGSPPSKSNNGGGASAVLSALANLASKKSPTPTTSTTAPQPAAQSAPASDSNPNAIFQLLQSMNKTSANSTPQQNSNVQTNNNNDHYRERESRDRNKPDNNRKRERSPARQPRSTHIEGEQNTPSNPHFRPKKPYIDSEIPHGCIGVLSRTIFIGGVPHSMGERELSTTLRPYAEVQSVILNNERKHAFVKVYSRAEAEQVIQALSNNHPSGLRARWGVGFGPRDCCNYQTGISTIPLDRLTDADTKWLTCAQWGGSVPELPVQSGLFVEEPDIEVGTGVSSKSISRKMPTNSNPNGPKSDGGVTTNGRNYNHRQNHHPQNQQHQQQQQHHQPQQQQQQHQQPMIPLQQQQQPYYGSPQGYGQPIQPQMPPQQIPSMGGGQPMMNQMPPVPPGGNQAQMMAMMAAMMGQMNGQQPNNGQQPDMAQMFQTMANMMQQQPQQPPQ